jgi:1-acyl-sn-glycerol-3-phosphate acyltransferase
MSPAAESTPPTPTPIAPESAAPQSSPDSRQIERAPAYSPGTFADPTRRSPLWRFLQIPAVIGCTLLFKVRVYGLHNVPKSGGVLLVSNHQSYLDPVLLALKLSRPVSYFAKSELFESRYFGALIRALHAFPVERGRGDKGAMEQAIRVLQQGYMLNFYPEGTRTETGEIGPMQRGISLIIRRAKVPVLPAAVHGSFEAWRPPRKFFGPHPIRVAYGRPMLLHELRADQILSRVGSAIGSLYDQLRAGKVPDESR